MKIFFSQKKGATSAFRRAQAHSRAHYRLYSRTRISLRDTCDARVSFSATSFFNSAHTSPITVDQSPLVACLNNRAVGYHGESLRSNNHRQSGLNGKSTQVALPKAPARLAVDVSQESTKSSDIMIAAVS